MSNENLNEVEVNEVSTEVEQVESNQENVNYILFDELKEKYESGKLIHEILSIKKYLPIINKQLMIENILQSSLELDDNGMTKINYTNLEMWYDINIIENYTNYAFTPDTIIQEFDYIVENGIFEDILCKISDREYIMINKNLDREIEQIIKLNNSIEGIVNNHLFILQDQIETLINKIPDMDKGFIEKLVTKATKAIGKFKPEDVKLIKELSDFAKNPNKFQGEDVKK